MSKRLILRAAACASLLSLAACGGGNTNDPSSSSAPTTSADSSTVASAVDAVMKLSAANYDVGTNASSAVITVNRSGAASGTSSVSYQTSDDTAHAGTDYAATSGTLTWTDGDTAPKSFAVAMIHGSNGKAFHVGLTGASGAAVGSPAVATVQVTANTSSSSSGASSSTSSSSSSSSSSGGSSKSTSSSSSSGASSSSSSGSTAKTSISTAKPFGIAVAGNKFVSTQTGEVLQLLGTSVSGLEQGNSSLANGVETYVSGTDAGFKAMASWNMNVVRIPLNEDTWLGIHSCFKDGGNSATLQSNVKQMVANANAAGMYVILDLHWTAPNSFGCPVGQGSMPDADNTVAFWTSVATMFKGNPAVMFEMFNEPFGTNSYGNWVAALGSTPSGQSASDLSILINGGTYYNGYMYQCNNGCKLSQGQEYTANTGSFETVGFQQIINAIRATGSTNVILMNSLGWAGQIQTWLTSRPTDPAGQLGVGWHEDGSNTSQASQVLASGLPIMMTEAYTMADATYAWAMQNKVGFSYWAWVDWSGGGILSNARTSTPSASGTQLKASYCTQPSVNPLSACN